MKVIPLRILHVVDDFSTQNTGVTNAVRQIAGWQAAQCEWVGVHTIGAVDLPALRGVNIFASPVHPLTPFWRYPQRGVAGLLELIEQQRITHLHIHEFWRAGFVVGMSAARLAGIPVVLSAHGLTAPWALEQQGWKNLLKKRLYWQLFARYFLLSRAALHAITPLEQQHMNAFLGRSPQVVIPNAVDLDDPLLAFDSTEPIEFAKQIVFLGRLHPVKGVQLLLEAFSRARIGSDWELVIAGPEEVPQHVSALKQAAARSHRAGNIRFAGALYGETKRQMLKKAWVVVVPSHTEVVGMVNLEAASLGTPTITTVTTGLTDWAEAGGLLVTDDVSGVLAALEVACAWSSAERLARGRKARAKVESVYSLKAVGNAWLNFYSELGADCDVCA